jgi:hypothetical protein
MQSLASRAAVSGGSRAGPDPIMVPSDRALSRWTWRIKGGGTYKFRADEKLFRFECDYRPIG